MRRVTSWRRLLLGLVGGLLLLVVLVFSYQAVRTVLALRDATHQTHQLGGEVRRNDVAAVEQTLRTLRARSATAHRSSDNVLWSMAARVPLVGKNVAAVQLMARALDEVSSRAYTPAVKLLDNAQVDTLRAPDGQIDLAAVARLEQPLRRLSKALDGAAHDVDAIDAPRLLGPLRDVTLGVQDGFRSSVSATRGGVTVARLLPAMLGSEGPRHYLLVVQNNAEIRSTGGCRDRS